MKPWLRLTLLACLALWPRAAHARPGDLLINLDVPLEFGPRRVCLHVEKLSNALAEKAKTDATPPGAPVGDSSIKGRSPDDCAQSTDQCNACKLAASTYEYCAGDARDKSHTLHLLLENLGLNAMRLEGQNLRLAVDYPETESVTPRLEVLGGNYHAGAVSSVSRGRDVVLRLLPRCIERPLHLPADVTPDATFKVVSNNQETKLSPGAVPLWKLYVRESGMNNNVTLARGDDSYSGSFDFPPPAQVQLLPTEFTLRWKRHCLVPADAGRNAPATPTAVRTIAGCPRAVLTQLGQECTALDCSPGVCCYKCSPGRPVEFPVHVTFVLPQTNLGPQLKDGTSTPPTPVEAPLDPLVWEGQSRFPGDELTGFIDSERRRIRLDWQKENALGRDWEEPGSEVDSIEIVGPDGKMQRLERGTSSLAVPGLQCRDRFTYRYVGRWPNNPRQDGLAVDKLVLDDSAKRQRPVLLAVRAHAGALVYTGVDSERAFSPYADIDGVGLIYGRWEVTASGVFSLHPTVFDSQEELSARRQMSALVRILLGPGWRIYWSDRIMLGLGLSFGIGFPALADDWTNVHQYPFGALRTRLGYEVTRSTMLEVGAWVFWPEQYIRSYQDFAGPRSLRTELTATAGISAGLQWADLL